MEFELCYFGNPSLRKKGKKIEKITPEIKKLAHDMLKAMHEFDGIGLAAPQIGIDLRIFVTCVPILQEDGSWTEGTDRVYINPQIISISEEKEITDEACLSLPGLSVPVERPISIHIKALDEEGNEVEEHFGGLFARNFLHENDHLNGVLTIDRTPANFKKKIKPLLDRMKKKYNS